MITRRATKPTFRATDPRLWDQLIALVGDHPRKKDGFWSPFIRLKLFHPTAPDAVPLSKKLSSMSKTHSHFSGNRKVQEALALAMRRAIAVLQWQAWKSDVEILVSLAKDHLQEVLYNAV